MAVSDDSIEHHIRTYRNILKQAGEVNISQLVTSHIEMTSVLHEKGTQTEIDTSAFIYSILRLPECISHVEKVLLGQSLTVFKKHGLENIEEWKEVYAPGRRRKIYYDDNKTLAVYISSVSDVDDIICLLTAYQIEWNKFHYLLTHSQTDDVIPWEDKERLNSIVKNRYELFLSAIRSRTLDYQVQLLSGSFVEYLRSTQMWWNHIRHNTEELHTEDRPVYFVSSNMHSLANIIVRTAVNSKDEIAHFIQRSGDDQLQRKYTEIFDEKKNYNKEFFLHYVSKKYERVNEEYRTKKQQDEKEAGIRTIQPSHYIDVPAQLIEVKHLAGRVLHSNFALDTRELSKSSAVIVNIDYPLGWAAYQILSEITQNIEYVAGVYIMGKAAILHGKIGDIVLPTEVYDEHTKNFFSFSNAFKLSKLKKWYETGAIFTAQKNISVKGTFFQNEMVIKQWYEKNYTTIEMEAGPYLNAISECIFYNRYVEQQVVHLPELPFDLGMAHYASDTPNSKAKNLGVRNLSYDGVECTYGITMAILERIIELELSYV